MCWLSSYHEADANYSDRASGSSRPIVDPSIGIDGEAIVVDQRGLSAFDLLRSWRHDQLVSVHQISLGDSFWFYALSSYYLYSDDVQQGWVISRLTGNHDAGDWRRPQEG